jgi:hypothetical protein
VIEEVLRGDPNPRYQIRWDDGGVSAYAPTDSGLRAEQRRALGSVVARATVWPWARRAGR